MSKSAAFDKDTSDRLNQYIAINLPELQVPVKLTKFAHGQSNPTFLLTDAGGHKYVLRRKPPGIAATSTAHNVEREYNILKGIAQYNATLQDAAQKVPVPKVYILCKDNKVIQSDFYIMEFLQGRIFTDQGLLEQIPKEKRAAYWKELVRIQALLSRVDPANVDVGPGFSTTKPFYERQIRSFDRTARDQAEAKDADTGEKVGLMPGFDEALAYFKKTIPRGIKDRGIAHGDLKMDNVVYHPTEPRVIGILDWELCALGAPISDFINGTSLFLRPPVESDDGYLGFAGVDVTSLGLPTYDELLRLWCEAAGVSYPPKELYWATAWHFLRSSVICQGIAARYARRQASHSNAQVYGARRFENMELARKYIELDQEHRTGRSKL